MVNLRFIATSFKKRFVRNKVSRSDFATELEDLNTLLENRVLPHDLQRTDTMFPNLSCLNWVLERALGATTSWSSKKKSKCSYSGIFAEESGSFPLQRTTSVVSISSLASLASTTTSKGSLPSASVALPKTAQVCAFQPAKCRSPKVPSGSSLGITETTPLNHFNASSALEAGSKSLVTSSFRSMPWTIRASFLRANRRIIAENILCTFLACLGLATTCTFFNTLFYLTTIGEDLTKYIDWLPWSLGASAAICIIFTVVSLVHYLVEGCSWKRASWESFKALELYVTSVGMVIVVSGGLMFLYMKTGWGV